MKLDEIFAAKPPTNKVVWRKRAGSVEKTYEIEPTVNRRNTIVTKGKDGRQQR